MHLQLNTCCILARIFSYLNTCANLNTNFFNRLLSNKSDSTAFNMNDRLAVRCSSAFNIDPKQNSHCLLDTYYQTCDNTALRWHNQVFKTISLKWKINSPATCWDVVVKKATGTFRLNLFIGAEVVFSAIQLKLQKNIKLRFTAYSLCFQTNNFLGLKRRWAS